MAKSKVSKRPRVKLPENLQDVTLSQAIQSLYPVFEVIPGPKVREVMPWMQAVEIGLQKARHLARELLRRLEEAEASTLGLTIEDMHLLEATRAFLVPAPKSEED